MCRNKVPTLGLGANMKLFNVPWCRFLLWCDGNYSWSSWDSQIQQRQPKGSNSLVNVSYFEGGCQGFKSLPLSFFFFLLPEIFTFQFHLLMQIPGMIFMRKYLVCSWEHLWSHVWTRTYMVVFLWYTFFTGKCGFTETNTVFEAGLTLSLLRTLYMCTT